MLTGVPVLAMGHGYNGPGAMAITIAVPVLLVLILVAAYGRKVVVVSREADTAPSPT